MQNHDDNIVGGTLYELVNIFRDVRLDQEEKKKR